MKIITIIWFLLSCTILFAQTTYVPDDDFEQALIDLGYDDVLDDYVLTSNISGATTLDVSYENISDLTGIADFTALTIFHCHNNQISTLDVSENMALIELRCEFNQLITLDVSQNTALTLLYCFFNQLNTLDVSQNTALTDLVCFDNQLSTLDVSQNTDIDILVCSVNQINNLDISQNTALTILDCSNNQLSILDISQNTALLKLWCHENQLSTLDVSQNTLLTDLFCSSNQLSMLDVTQNIVLTHLNCRNNQINTLDVSLNTELTFLICYSNLLDTLDVRNGANSNISHCDFAASNNPNLTCILVDDAEWSAENWTNIDPTSTFVETQEECDALGVDEVIFSEGLQVYPNPTQDLINVETTDLTDKKYTIYNIYGSISKQGVLNDEQIDISALKAGIYLFKLGDMTTKIVKL